VLTLLSSCGRTNITNVGNDNIEFQVLSIKELYPQAKKAALEWQEDAYLDMITLNVFPKTENFRSSAYFTFRSHTFPEIYFGYDYIENSTIEINQSEGEYPMLQPPDLEINPDVLPFDSLDAVKIMYEELGKEIYTNCSIGSWPALLGLEHRIPDLEEPTWSISFTCTSPQNWGAIIINAETGEVLEIRK
jgi:hypothetical protein